MSGGSIPPNYSPVDPSRQTITIKFIHPLQAGLVSAIITALIPGIIAMVAGFFMLVLGAASGESAAVGASVLVMIGAPLMYAVVGFLSGLVGAVIYNIAAGMGVGLRFDVQ